jgi:hypothetical protein
MLRKNLNKYFLVNRIIKYLSAFIIFSIFLTSLFSLFGCKSEEVTDETDWNEIIEFVPFEKMESLGEKQVFKPIEITILHTNDVRGNIQPCG